jgi:hypothetical protein
MADMPSSAGPADSGPHGGLDAEGLRALLALLGPDPESAALKYEHLRRSLAIFFEARRCANGERLADLVMDRVARRLREGAAITAREPDRYVFGVARMIALEEHRRVAAMPTVPLQWDVAAAGPKDDEGLECLDRCLEALETRTRETILAYYCGKGREKLEHRRRLAESLGIAHDVLVCRVHRVRSRLADCVRKCQSHNR